MKNWKNWAIVVLLGAIIICLIMWPDPVPPEVQKQIDPHMDAIKVLNHKVDSLQGRTETIQKKAKDDSLKSARREIAYKRELKGAQAVNDSARATVQHLIDSIPALEVAFRAADSVAAVQGRENDSLREDLRMRNMIIRDLSGTYEETVAAQFEKIGHLEEVINIQERAIRKYKRKRVVGRILGGALIGTAFWLGTQL